MVATQGRTTRARRRGATWAALFVAVVLLTGAESSCQTRTVIQSSESTQSSVQSDSAPAGGDTRVHYKVSSDADIRSVTYIDSQGRTTTRTNVGRSWFATGTSSGGVVMVTATTGPGSTTITCTMSIAGKVVQRATASGGGSTTVVCRASP